MTLPVMARHEDTLVQGQFRKWIIRHIDSWFAFSRQYEFDIEMCHDQREDSRWVSNVYYSVWIDYTWTMTRSSKHGNSA